MFNTYFGEKSFSNHLHLNVKFIYNLKDNLLLLTWISEEINEKSISPIVIEFESILSLHEKCELVLSTSRLSVFSKDSLHQSFTKIGLENC